MFSDLIDKPFSDFGRGPDVYDCWGVFLEVNRRVGRNAPDYHDMICPSDIAGIEMEYQRHRHEWSRIEQPEAAAGDLVVIKRMDDPRGFHFGVMIGPVEFLHCTPGSGVKMERIDHPIRRQLIKGIYRCKISTS